jgi:hypothetical protein
VPHETQQTYCNDYRQRDDDGGQAESGLAGARRDGSGFSPGLRRSRADGLRRLLDNCACGTKDWKEKTAFCAPDAFPNMDFVSVVRFTALRTCNLDHFRGTPRNRQNDILFWDSNARLAIIQSS